MLHESHTYVHAKILYQLGWIDRSGIEMYL